MAIGNIMAGELNWYFYSISVKGSIIYIFFKCTWDIFHSRPLVSHKINFNKFKNFKIISTIFTDHNDMKAEINYKKKTE